MTRDWYEVVTLGKNPSEVAIARSHVAVAVGHWLAAVEEHGADSENARRAWADVERRRLDFINAVERARRP